MWYTNILDCTKDKDYTVLTQHYYFHFGSLIPFDLDVFWVWLLYDASFSCLFFVRTELFLKQPINRSQATLLGKIKMVFVSQNQRTERSLELPYQDAIRASKRIQHLKNPEKLDTVIRFLRQIGIRKSDIRYHFPQPSSVSVQYCAKEDFWMQALGSLENIYAVFFKGGRHCLIVAWKRLLCPAVIIDVIHQYFSIRFWI